MFYLWLGIHQGTELEESGEFSERIWTSSSLHSAESLYFLPWRIRCWRQTASLHMTFVWFSISENNLSFWFLWRKCKWKLNSLNSRFFWPFPFQWMSDINMHSCPNMKPALSNLIFMWLRLRAETHQAGIKELVSTKASCEHTTNTTASGN